MLPLARGRRLPRWPWLALAAAAILARGAGARAADDTARVVLLSVPDVAPGAEAVRPTLALHLERVEVAVEVAQRPAAPTTDAEWSALAGELAAQAPGTLALFGWSCGGSSCDLVVAEPRGGAVAHVPVRPAGPEAGDEGRLAFALAATAREAVWGGLLLEMGRLPDEGARPTEPPPSGQRLPAPHGGGVDAGGLARARRPWLWLEGGYHGEYSHPRGGTLHGPFVALALSPGRNVVPVVRAGWLGIAVDEGPGGVARSHAFPVELELRVAFPIGPAMFSIAPVGRVDLVAATADPEGEGGPSTSLEVDLHVGGATTWHLPLPGGRVEALVGMGALATIIGNAVEAADGVGVPASKLRVVWSAGVSWSPL